MAEITLITGTPGAGKTAHMVHLMLHDPIFKDAQGNPRKVFTNIKGLQLPHIEVSSLESEQAASTPDKLSFHDCYKWIQQPENHGSILIIDEVQDVWPARSNGSKVPPNVAWLNTHRHLGVDIFVLTQNPKNIDMNLRGLVNKHWHIAKNKLGMRTILEWKYCATNPLTQAKDAFAKVHKLDKKVFDLYKSAEIHTENSNKVSKVVFILPLMLVIMPIMIYMSYAMLKNLGKPKEAENEQTALSASAPNGNIQQQIDAATALQNPQQNTLGAKPEDFIPRLAEKPETKPLYDGQRTVTSMEYPVACVKVDARCTCYSEQGTKIKEISQTLCTSYLTDGMPFNPYKRVDANNQRQNVPQTADNAGESHPSQVVQLDGEVRPSLTPAYPESLRSIQ